MITLEFKSKVDFICSNIKTKEWSGIAFYEFKNSGNVEEWEFKLIDLYLLDIGTVTRTIHDESTDEDYLDFLIKNGHYQRGSIHSHNNMSVFHSSTDVEDLRKYAAGFNIYVSVVCNNKGEYDIVIVHKGEEKIVFKDTIGNTFEYNEECSYCYKPNVIIDYGETGSIMQKIIELNAIKTKSLFSTNQLAQKEKVGFRNDNTDLIINDNYYEDLIDEFTDELIHISTKRDLDNLSFTFFSCDYKEIDVVTKISIESYLSDDTVHYINSLSEKDLVYTYE